MHSFQQRKKPAGIYITHDNNRIKQFHINEYLGCCLDVNLSGESMVVQSLKKINAALHVEKTSF